MINPISQGLFLLREQSYKEMLRAGASKSSSGVPGFCTIELLD